MKALSLGLLILVTCLRGLGQESHYFTIPIDSSKAVVPVPNPTMHGSAIFGFASTGEFGINLFLFNPDQARVTSVELFRSTSAAQLGISVATLTLGAYADPDPPSGFIGGQEWDFWRVLAEDEKADVFAGNWWIIAKTAEFPQGEVRAQIVVPEQSTIVLFLVGIGFIRVWRRRMI
jgi:hypothetical protein